MTQNDADGFIFDGSYPIALLWGLLIVTSFLGWGNILGRVLVPDAGPANYNWGTSIVRGLTAFLVLSGLMIALSIFSASFLWCFLSAGWLLLAWHFWIIHRQSEAWSGPPTFGLKAAFWIILCLVALTYAGAVASHVYSPYDDFQAYFPLTKMVLDTGTFYDPFSFRLLGALGGQTALDALIVVALPWKYVNLVDIGISGLMILLLTQEIVQGHDKKAWIARLLLLGLVLTFPIPRANTASECTGMIFYMALFHGLHLVVKNQLRGWRMVILLGAIITAASTLRAHNFFVIAILGSSFVAWRLWEEKGHRREILVETAGLVGAVFLFLLPWWIVAYRSGGVFLYPLVRGNHRPEFETFSGHLPFLTTLEFIGLFLVSYYYLPLFFPAFALTAGRDRRFLFLVGGALFGTSLLIMEQLTFALPRDIFRYLTPIGAAFGFYTAGCLAQQMVTAPSGTGGKRVFSRSRCVAWIAVCTIVLQGLNFAIGSIINICKVVGAFDARHGLVSITTGPVSTTKAETEYRKAFAQIPPHARVLIALDFPFYLDYRAHAISSIDVAGAASPDPGLPYFRGAEAVKKYLLSKGIRYIAQVPFDQSKCLHSREVQNQNLNQPIVAYRYYATFEIDFYNNVDQLAKTNPILFDSSTIRVIDLQD